MPGGQGMGLQFRIVCVGVGVSYERTAIEVYDVVHHDYKAVLREPQ